MIQFLFFATTLFSFGLSYAHLHPSSVTQVQLSQFVPGHVWSWQYSEQNRKTGAWEPYLIERYTVTEVSGSKITIEMSSDSPNDPRRSKAHHKFVFNFKSCETARANPGARKWTVEFYSTSLTGSWSLVSRTHPNHVFTEKFNCSNPNEKEVVQNGTYSLPSGAYPTFRIERGIKEDTSWYFTDHPEFRGVLANKLFYPTLRYRAELM